MTKLELVSLRKGYSNCLSEFQVLHLCHRGNVPALHSTGPWPELGEATEEKLRPK